MGFGVEFLKNRQLQAATALVKTATATLTIGECIEYDRVSAGHASTAVTLTLPVAATALSGVVLMVGNDAAQTLTLTVAAGFGGGGAGHDTVTMAVGEGVLVWCDGTYWYCLAAVVPS